VRTVVAKGKCCAQRSTSPLGHEKQESRALKVRNRFYGRDVMPLLQSLDHLLSSPGAPRLAALSACPWLLHFRASGAQESNNSTTSTRCTSNLNSRKNKSLWGFEQKPSEPILKSSLIVYGLNTTTRHRQANV
jgi:hypothetical protein